MHFGTYQELGSSPLADDCVCLPGVGGTQNIVIGYEHISWVALGASWSPWIPRGLVPTADDAGDADVGVCVWSAVLYEVTVVTGELWNAGTDASVSLTLYGEMGDTGARLLRRSRSRITRKMFSAGQVTSLPLIRVVDVVMITGLVIVYWIYLMLRSPLLIFACW